MKTSAIFTFGEEIGSVLNHFESFPRLFEILRDSSESVTKHFGDSKLFWWPTFVGKGTQKNWWLKIIAKIANSPDLAVCVGE